MTAEAVSLGVQLSGESAEVRREWLVTGALEGGRGRWQTLRGQEAVVGLAGNCLEALFNAGAAFSGFPNSNGTGARTSAQD